MEIKNKFYKELGSIVKPSGIFASNTSSFEIGFMTEASGRPDKMVRCALDVTVLCWSVVRGLLVAIDVASWLRAGCDDVQVGMHFFNPVGHAAASRSCCRAGDASSL
jgi:hypothetical protein